MQTHLSKYHSLGLTPDASVSNSQLFDSVLQLTLLRVDEVGVSCSLCAFSAGLGQTKELADHLYWRHEMKNRERMLSLFNPEAGFIFWRIFLVSPTHHSTPRKCPARSQTFMTSHRVSIIITRVFSKKKC